METRQARILDERIHQRRHLPIGQDVRARPLKQRALFERIERQPVAHVPKLCRLDSHTDPSLPGRVHELDPRLEHRDDGDGDGSGQQLREGDAVHGRHHQLMLRCALVLQAHVAHDRHQDVALEQALGQRFDHDLGDDARGLVRGHELAQAVGQGQRAQQPEGLEEHEKVESDHSEREAEPEEELVRAARATERGVQVREHAKVHDEELQHQQPACDARIHEHARLVQQHGHLDVGDDVREVQPDDDQTVERALGGADETRLHAPRAACAL